MQMLFLTSGKVRLDLSVARFHAHDAVFASGNMALTPALGQVGVWNLRQASQVRRYQS